MKIFNGTSAGHGTAHGRISIYHRGCERPQTRSVIDTEAEQSRFKLARYIAVKELAALYERAYAELGESAAMIFHIHQLMLDDETFTGSVCSIIEEKQVCAEAAVAETADILTAFFTEMSDGYMSARGADVRDICDRVNAILSSANTPYPQPQEPSIIVANELSPSEILLADKSLILGLVLTGGAPDSHASILARRMNIPSICQTNIDVPISDGMRGTVDADKGIFVLDG